ncbi:hypothetical protein, partial [Hungatella sp. SL.1.14]|uniref:hypothetical protein n=1 Tax=Hungatella sp. SL.1.14 TaxID=2963703 RepID=UPI00210DAB23
LLLLLLYGFCFFTSGANTQPKFLWEGEGEAGKRADFSFPRRQELKPEGRKKGRIAANYGELLKDFSSVCARKLALRPTFAPLFSCLPT